MSIPHWIMLAKVVVSLSVVTLIINLIDDVKRFKRRNEITNDVPDRDAP